MVLRVSSTSDAPNGQVRISFVALSPSAAPVAAPAPTAPATPGAPTMPRQMPGPVSQYPGFDVVGNFNIAVSEADGAEYTRGKQFNLVAAV